MTRYFNYLLLALAAGLAVQLIVLQNRLAPIRSEHQRLTKQYGFFDVKNEDKYLLMNIPTGDPTHFLWRCYFPANLSLVHKLTAVDGHTSIYCSNIRAREELIRYRFEFTEDDLHVHRISPSSSGMYGVGDKELASFIKENWNELLITHSAEGRMREISTSEVLPMLTIRVPEELVSETEQVPAGLAKRLKQMEYLFKFEIGTDSAMKAQKNQ